jgi:hypothetical protein
MPARGTFVTLSNFVEHAEIGGLRLGCKVFSQMGLDHAEHAMSRQQSKSHRLLLASSCCVRSADISQGGNTRNLDPSSGLAIYLQPRCLDANALIQHAVKSEQTRPARL